MSKPTVSRTELFAAWHTTIKAHFVEARDLVAAAYDYLPTDPKGLSPIIATVPLGSRRSKEATRMWNLQMQVGVFLMALYSHKELTISETTSWASLNTLEDELGAFVEEHFRTEFWRSIEWMDFGEVEIVPIDNTGYLVEAITLVVTA